MLFDHPQKFEKDETEKAILVALFWHPIQISDKHLDDVFISWNRS